MTQTLLAIGVSLTLLVSPEVQTMLGNGVGQAGTLFFPAMLLAGIVHLFTIRLYDHIPSTTHGTGETKFITDNFGHPAALFLFLSGRVVLMATLSTIILATAGYVFNEVFLYWFPNFGFAFLLLGLILTANIIGPTFARYMQAILVATVLLAIFILSIAAFMQSGIEQIQPHFNLRSLLLPFMMIIGIELFKSVPARSNQNNKNTNMVSMTLILTLLILILWAGSMMHLVPAEKLASSFIPHIKAARQALGQPGRIIAGIMVIAGVAATINGLLLALSTQAKKMAQEGHLPLWFTKESYHINFPLILLAACPAALMSLGMAGHDITEVYVRGSLLFWLLHYCLIHLAAYNNNFPARFFHLLTSLLFACVIVGLIFTDPQQELLLLIMAYIGITCALLSFLSIFFRNKFPQGGTYEKKNIY